jgi:Arc/MetJ family transcription regulator
LGEELAEHEDRLQAFAQSRTDVRSVRRAHFEIELLLRRRFPNARAQIEIDELALDRVLGLIEVNGRRL